VRRAKFELVGISHARYSAGEALNVVVGIDQVRDLMTTLKRTPRARHDVDSPLDTTARAGLLTSLQNHGGDAFFPFGALTASARAEPSGSLVFRVYPADFPLRDAPLLIIEDGVVATAPSARAPTAFGEIVTVTARNQRGAIARGRTTLDSESLGVLSSVLDGLRRAAILAFVLRDADKTADASREHSQYRAQMELATKKRMTADQDLSLQSAELADALGPDASEPAAGTPASVTVSVP
jgi:serine protease Do